MDKLEPSDLVVMDPWTWCLSPFALFVFWFFPYYFGYQKWVNLRGNIGADIDCGLLFFRKALSQSLRCDVLFIVKPSKHLGTRPTCQVTSQEGGRQCGFLVHYSTVETLPGSPQACMVFPLLTGSFLPFTSVYLMGEESKLLCIEMSGWTWRARDDCNVL